MVQQMILGGILSKQSSVPPVTRNIIAVINPNPITVPNGTAFGVNGAGVGLPPTVSVQLDDLSFTTLNVTWSGTYNPTTAAAYPISGTIQLTPLITNNIIPPIAASCTVTVSALVVYSITSINPQVPVTVPFGTPFASVPKPSQVTVLLSGGGGSRTIDVISWAPGSYNGNVAGPYTTLGTLGNYPPDITPTSLTASLSITVSATSTANWWVNNVTGLDTNTGAQNSPFKSIAKAGQMAQALLSGDCIIHIAGTGVDYRETIVPTNSGNANSRIIYRNVPGGPRPRISGFNQLTAGGWTAHDLTGGKHIYKKTVTLPVNGYDESAAYDMYRSNIVANQFLKDETIQVEARWPKINPGTADLFEHSKYKNGIDYSNGFNMRDLTDPALSTLPNLVNGYLRCNGWFSEETRKILTHVGSKITWSLQIWDDLYSKAARKRYYVTGLLSLLSAPGEFHYQNGTLYYWQVGGGVPTGNFEYKARNFGFDLRGRKYITIKGIEFTGCDPVITSEGVTSQNIIIDNTKARYMDHYVIHPRVQWQGVGMCQQFGSKLVGDDCQFINNEWFDSAGTSLWVGNRCKVHNNLMHDIGYAGYWGNAVSNWGTVDGVDVQWNTIYRTGRSSYDFGFNFGVAPGSSKHYNCIVANNDFSQWGKLSGDVGATYVWGQCVLTGLQYRDNWIYNAGQPDRGDVGVICGIYFDQSTGPGNIYRNICWLTSACDMYHETWNEERPHKGNWGANASAQLNVYNNTFGNTSGSPAHDNPSQVFPRSYVAYRSAPFDRGRNNIYVSQIVVSGGDIANSVMPGENPQFIGGDRNVLKGKYYRISSTSPARGRGVATFPGATGGTITAHTDAGAYPFGAVPTTPGYVAVPLT